MRILYALLIFALGAAAGLALMRQTGIQHSASERYNRAGWVLPPATGEVHWPLQNGNRAPQKAPVRNARQSSLTTPAPGAMLQEIRWLLGAGQETAALQLYRQRCRGKVGSTGCKSIFFKHMNYLFQNNLQRLSQFLEAWLTIEVEDPHAVFYQGAMYAQQGRPREALQRLLYLQSKPQDEVPQAVISNAVQTVFQMRLEQLRRQKNPESIVEFLDFMHSISPGNPQYRYLKAESLLEMKRHFEAVSALEEILYDPDWGTQAQALAATVEQRLATQSQIRVPLIRSGEHFLVRTAISGAELLLLLDTGASYTAVDRRAFRNLGVNSQPIRRVLLHTPNGNVRAPLVRVSRLGVVGGPELRDLEIALMPLGNLPGTEGLLGMNYLSRFDFYIDQDDALLYLNQRD